MAKSNQYSGICTKAVHAGEGPDPATGASAPSISMSSTFVTDESAGFSAHELDETSPFVYARWGNPTVRQLERKVSALEETEATVCFASGMAASSAVFFSLLSAGDHAVVSNVCYAGVAELVRDSLPRFGIEISLVDSSDTDAVAAAMRPNTRLVYVETPANPILRLTDLQAVAGIAHAGGAKMAVDSTFATPIATKPHALGVDYVMHSLTKYIGGHGDALGGSLSGTREAMAHINTEAAIHYGGVLSPFNAWLIQRGAATLPIRMAQHQKTALAVARYLEGHPKVGQVLYPGLDSHPQRDLAKRQMANTSAMLSFQAGDGEKLAAIMAEHLGIIHYAVSLGHHRSLICWIGTDGIMETSFRLEGDALAAYRAVAGDGVFRMSIGLEDADDLIADLDQALARV